MPVNRLYRQPVFSFKLYRAHSREARWKFAPHFGRIVCWVAELNAGFASLPERGNDCLKYFISSSVNQTTNCRVIVRLCSFSTFGLDLKFYILSQLPIAHCYSVIRWWDIGDTLILFILKKNIYLQKLTFLN